MSRYMTSFCKVNKEYYQDLLYLRNQQLDHLNRGCNQLGTIDANHNQGNHSHYGKRTHGCNQALKAQSQIQISKQIKPPTKGKSNDQVEEITSLIQTLNQEYDWEIMKPTLTINKKAIYT